MAEIFGNEKAKVEHVLTERDRLKVEFGWKEKYSATKSTEAGATLRSESERKAEEQLIRQFGYRQ